MTLPSPPFLVRSSCLNNSTLSILQREQDQLPVSWEPHLGKITSPFIYNAEHIMSIHFVYVWECWGEGEWVANRIIVSPPYQLNLCQKKKRKLY